MQGNTREQAQTPYRAARIAAGLTQRKAYESIPVSKRAMAHYEKDKEPPPDVVIRMDKLYKCEGELVKSWLRKLGFDGTIKFSFGTKRKAILTAIKIACRKIFDLS